MRALVLGSLLLASPALAWDSLCDKPPDGACAGPEAAQHRWIDAANKDEHRQLFLQALTLNNFAETDFTVSSFTASSMTLKPAPLNSALAVVERTRAPSEFAQLPDFSYSLWDWSTGNETCPLDVTFTQGLCHDFLGHMGVTNSNHFLPQAQTNYQRYHVLAMGRANECKALRTKLSMRPDLQRFVDACVSEALVLEAIGHHFLQDAWSMGHTWERWGSPDETDYAGAAVRGGLVSSLAGLIHGGKAVLRSIVPSGVDPDDAMNAPFPDVTLSHGGATMPAVGDLYISLLGTSMYATQQTALMQCAVGGIDDVLTAAGATHQVSSAVTPRDPFTDPSCFSQRATNEALNHGFAVDLKVGGVQLPPIPLANVVNGVKLITGSLVASPSLQFDLARMQAVLAIKAVVDPHGTDMASGGLGPLLGIPPNGAYNKVGAYIDPMLPWPATTVSLGGHDEELARQFHVSHAKDWCGVFGPGNPDYDLDALKGRVASTSGQEQGVACSICAEFTERALRIGDQSTYVPSDAIEPVCGLVADMPSLVQYRYIADAGTATDRHDLALSYCGCSPLSGAGGTFNNAAAGQLQTLFFVRFRDDNGLPPAAQKTITVTGPAAWNNSAALTSTYPAGALRQFITFAKAPVSGTYQLSMTSSSGRPVSTTVTLDATASLPPPTNLMNDLSVSGQISMSWDAVPDAGSYLARDFDVTTGRVRTPTEFTHATSATLVGVPINAADQNALQVWAFSNDMTVADPPVPAKFNASFDRMLLAPKLTVTPTPQTVMQGASTSVTATLTGLPDTTVTWSANGGMLVPSGNTAMWTAPMVNGTYQVTARSNYNSTLVAHATMTVPGGSPCDLNAVANKYVGTWHITAAAPMSGEGTYCYTGLGGQWAQGGSFTITAAGNVGTLIPNAALQSQTGTFRCQDPTICTYSFLGFPIACNESLGGSVELSMMYGSETDPNDQNYAMGQVYVQDLNPHVVGCIMAFEAVR